MSRFNVTIAGTIDTWMGEAAIERDAAPFLAAVEAVHPDIEAGSVHLVSVEPAPDAPTTVELTLTADEERIVEETLRRFRSTTGA